MREAEQNTTGERIACSDGIDGFDRKPLDVFGRAIFDDVAPLFATSDEGEVACRAQFPKAFLKVICLKKVMSFVQVAKYDVGILRNDFPEIVSESVDQKPVGKGKRRSHAQSFRLLEYLDTGFSRVFRVP